MNQDFSVRLAVAADLPRLTAIEEAAAALFPPGSVPDAASTVPQEMLAQGLASGLLWVVEYEHKPVGFALAESFGDQLHLHEMDVHPDFGRRGLGTRLVNHVIDQAGQRGCTAVTLTTFGHLPWNRPFYNRLGFQVLSEGEIEPRLAEILEEEARAGLKSRVAMRFELVNR